VEGLAPTGAGSSIHVKGLDMKKIANKLRKSVAVAALAGMLAVTGGTVAQVATAENSKAQAYSYTQGPQKWQNDRYYSGGRAYCGVWAYVDYDWWEESWFGGSHRDGWQRLYYAYC
jgi:hypothetical protein